MHGTKPGGTIVCHQATRIKDDYGLVLLDLKGLIRLLVEVVNIFQPTKVVAVGLDSIGVTDKESQEVAAKIEKKTARPPVDAFHLGSEQLTNPLLRHFESKKQ